MSAPESSVFGALINGSASSQRAALVFGDAYPGARKGSIAIIQSALVRMCFVGGQHRARRWSVVNGPRHHRIRHAECPYVFPSARLGAATASLDVQRTLLAIWLIFPCSFTDTLHPSLEESCAVGWSEERAGWRRVHGRPSKRAKSWCAKTAAG